MAAKSLLTKAGATLAAAVMIVVVLPGVANAGTDAQACVFDNDGNHIACAFFNHDLDGGRERLLVCDYRSDGHKAVGSVKWGDRQVFEEDRALTGSCTPKALDIAEDTPVELRVCIPDIDRCSQWRDGRA